MNKPLYIILHVGIWAYMFLSPLLFMRGSDVNIIQYLMNCMTPLLMMVVFYANFFWLTPYNFVIGKRRYYLLFNLLMVVVFGTFLHSWSSYTQSLFHEGYYYESKVDTLNYIFRDMLSLAMSAGMATAIVLATKWQRNEEARLEAENARVDAELKNLRSQVNPHFLLNTLNNIYALTAIDQPRAQDAIQQLSKLLRHMLYDNQEAEVVLKDEIQFIENYVSLMKIRLSSSVDVRLEKDVQDPCVRISPLIFISLVENAFKHGISPTEPSFVHIKLTQRDNTICFNIKNSNYPKNSYDRSGHGIGLQQVQRRLDYAYAGCYEWVKGVVGKERIYSSTIIIKL